MESTILTNMCMVTNEEGQVLVQMHGGNWKGWCFPGGHVEPKESFVESVIREVREESGLTIQHPKICGVKQFFSGRWLPVCGAAFPGPGIYR